MKVSSTLWPDRSVTVITAIEYCIVLVLVLGSALLVISGWRGASWSRRFARVVGGGVVVGLAIAALSMLRWFGEASTTTDPRHYARIFANRQGSLLVAHFPPVIPSDAANVRFCYVPGLGQGVAVRQLRYTTSPQQLARLSAKFRRVQLESFTGGRGGTIMPYSPPFMTDDGRRFTADYTIIVLYASPHPKGTVPTEVSGVAISTARHEIVYWAESG